MLIAVFLFIYAYSKYEVLQNHGNTSFLETVDRQSNTNAGINLKQGNFSLIVALMNQGTKQSIDLSSDDTFQVNLRQMSITRSPAFSMD